MLRTEFHATLQSERRPQRPELWDGRTAEQIVEIMATMIMQGEAAA